MALNKLEFICRTAKANGADPLEITCFRRYVRGEPQGEMGRMYLGPYGFTSPNIMVRGRKVSVFGADRPFALPS